MKPTIVIEVGGGVVRHIAINDPSIEIVVVDFDNIEAGDPFPTKPNIAEDVLYEGASYEEMLEFLYGDEYLNSLQS